MRLLVFALLPCLLVGTARAEDEKPAEPPRHDQWLYDWVRSVAKFDVMPNFHESFPSSPHKQDTEEYEVAFKAYLLRRDRPERVQPLADKLMALYAKEQTYEGVRDRIVLVLGRLGTPNAVDLLCRAATSTREARASNAIGSLACYGATPRELGFMLFGGTPRWVVFPVSHSSRAATTLCNLLDGKHPRRTKDETTKEWLERKDAWRSRLGRVIDALEGHRGPDVVTAAIEALVGKDGFAGGRCNQHSLVALLQANAKHARPEHRERLRAVAEDDDAPLWLRERAVSALTALDNPTTEEGKKPGIYRLGR